MQKKPESNNVDLTHMPQYIKQAPWYIDTKDAPVLTHQRARNDNSKPSMETWYKRGVNSDIKVTKYRKGACQNCGAMTHQAKFCTERPRKIGAKFTGRDFAHDENVQKIELGYEAKRDRWNGYDPHSFNFIVEEWNSLNEEQKKKKAREFEERIRQKEERGDAQDSDSQSDSGDSDKEKNVDESNFANKDPRVRTTIRNLRIREDIAKYLRNLDPSSAVYDGKSRTMKENPNPDVPESQQTFKGDNYAKVTGDYIQMMNQEGFVLEAGQAGVEVNNMAMPSQVFIMHKQFKEKKEQLLQKKANELTEKYGGAEHQHMPEEIKESIRADIDDLQMKQRTLAQTQHVQKFDSKGLIGIKSKYEEDLFERNHISVWGSYWHGTFGWGFRCCYSFDKESDCRGEDGRIETLRKEIELEIKEKAAKDAGQEILVVASGVDLKSIEALAQNQRKKDVVLSSSDDDQSSSGSEESGNDASQNSDSSGPRRKQKKKRETKREAKTQEKFKKLEK